MKKIIFTLTLLITIQFLFGQNNKVLDSLQNKAIDELYSGLYKDAEKTIFQAIDINPKSKKNIIIAAALDPVYGMELVEGGVFLMGKGNGLNTELPIHPVELNSFEVSKYEITNLQYAVFLNQYGSDSVINNYKYDGQKMITEHQWGLYHDTIANKWFPQKGYEFHPVINVSWYGALEFADFYNLQLLSEAQWEYVGGGGNKTPLGEDNAGYLNLQRFSGTNTAENLKDYSWYLQTIEQDTSTREVGLLKPNFLEIYDLNGNANEWCLDMFSIYFYRFCFEQGTVKNPLSSSPSTERAVRGGSYLFDADSIYISYRDYASPTTMENNLSFRVAFLPFDAQNYSTLTKKDNKYALINKNNSVVSEFYDAIYDFHELDAAVVRNNTKYGAINHAGQEVIPCKFNREELNKELEKYVEKYMTDYPNSIEVFIYKGNKVSGEKAVEFYDKALAVEPNNAELYVVIGDKIKKRNELKSLEYYLKANEIKAETVNLKDKFEFINGIAPIENKDKKYGVINESGEVISKKWYDNWSNESDIMIGLQKGEMWDLMNNEGDILLKYVHLLDFSEGLAFIQKKVDGEWGVINEEGKLVIKYKFEHVISPFEDGKAEVMNDDRYFYINKRGNEVKK